MNTFQLILTIYGIIGLICWISVLQTINKKHKYIFQGPIDKLVVFLVLTFVFTICLWSIYFVIYQVPLYVRYLGVWVSFWRLQRKIDKAKRANTE